MADDRWGSTGIHECASEHDPSDTACKTFERGLNGRCVYCDHEYKCYPGPGATCWIFDSTPEPKP